MSEYTRQVHAQIVPQQRYAALFAGIVYRFPQLCSELLSRSPTMQQAVFSTLRGDLTFRQMSARLVTQPAADLIGSPVGGGWLCRMEM